MKLSLLKLLACVECGGQVELADEVLTNEEVESGTLRCSACRTTIPISGFIPRFVRPSNYADNFGLEWNRFQRTQLDSNTGLSISRERFLDSTRWAAESLKDALVLDVGCGSGRFVEIALSLGAEVVAVDYSSAVDACWGNFTFHPKLHIIQAGVYKLPFKPDQFSYVYCLGVVQHTPNPRGAVLSMARQLNSGGQLAFDVYPGYLKNLLHPRYFLRPITRKLSPRKLFTIVERSVPVLLPISRAVSRVPGIGPILRRLVPVANYEGVYPLNKRQLLEWAILDTYDWLSPAYDQPQKSQTLKSWLQESGLSNCEVCRVRHLVGRGIRSEAQL